MGRWSRPTLKAMSGSVLLRGGRDLTNPSTERDTQCSFEGLLATLTHQPPGPREKTARSRRPVRATVLIPKIESHGGRSLEQGFRSVWAARAARAARTAGLTRRVRHRVTRRQEQDGSLPGGRAREARGRGPTFEDERQRARGC